jgi:thioredoxin-like negative regulator of GroEL
VNELEKEYSGKVEFETIDADDYQTYSRYQSKFKFQSLPTVIVLDSSGNVVLKESGIRDKNSYRSKLVGALDKATQ